MELAVEDGDKVYTQAPATAQEFPRNIAGKEKQGQESRRKQPLLLLPRRRASIILTFIQGVAGSVKYNSCFMIARRRYQYPMKLN